MKMSQNHLTIVERLVRSVGYLCASRDVNDAAVSDLMVLIPEIIEAFENYEYVETMRGAIRNLRQPVSNLRRALTDEDASIPVIEAFDALVDGIDHTMRAATLGSVAILDTDNKAVMQ